MAVISRIWSGRFRSGCALVLCSLLAIGNAEADGSSASSPQEISEELKAAQEAYGELKFELILELHDLAKWCGTQKLNAERQRIYQAVLLLNPDDRDAHKGLRHEREGDKWVVPENKRPSKNFNRSKLDDCQERNDALNVGFREKVLELLAELSEEQRGELRKLAFADILALNPNDAVVREMRGEILLGEQWLLQETASGKRRRPQFKAWVSASLKVLPKRVEFTEEERDMGVAWKMVLASEHVRVLTSGDSKEAARVAQGCEGAVSLFRKVFGTETQLPEGYTVFLLTDKRQRDQFIAGYPGLKDADRERYAKLVGTGLPGAIRVARWESSPALRLDGAVHHTVAELLRQEFDIFLNPGWAWEGLGLYLTRQLTGTRLSWYVAPKEDSDKDLVELRSQLGHQKLNWMNEVWKLYDKGKATPFDVFLERSLNDMTVPDVLTAYAFAGFLLEGNPENLAPMLSQVGQKRPAPGWIGETWGGLLDRGASQPALDLQERFLRWLNERR